MTPHRRRPNHPSTWTAAVAALVTLAWLLGACNRGQQPGPRQSTTPEPAAEKSGPPPPAAPAPQGRETMEEQSRTGGEPLQGLMLALEAQKTVYQQKEPLQLRATLHNTGATPLVVMRRAYHVDLGIGAFNDQGEFITSLLPPSPPPPPGKQDLAELPPGGSLPLGDWELLQRVNQQIMAGNGRTGRFTVSAAYHAGIGVSENLKKLDRRAWTGQLASNKVVIEVR